MKKSWKQTKQARYKARKPYIRLLEYARRRCNDPEHKSGYYAKGITCDLTGAEMAAIWERDKAHLLKRPSLDRKDATGNYTAFNCRIIEFALNARLAWDKSAAARGPTPEFT